MAQTAASKGRTAEQFAAMMADVRCQAIDQAFKDGKLTQAQADWMKQRGAIDSGGAAREAGRGIRETAWAARQELLAQGVQHLDQPPTDIIRQIVVRSHEGARIAISDDIKGALRGE